MFLSLCSVYEKHNGYLLKLTFIVKFKLTSQQETMNLTVPGIVGTCFISTIARRICICAFFFEAESATKASNAILTKMQIMHNFCYF